MDSRPFSIPEPCAYENERWASLASDASRNWLDGEQLPCLSGIDNPLLSSTAVSAQRVLFAKWHDRVVRQDAVSAVVATHAFRRLADVSFLGALDYTHRQRGTTSKFQRSRAAHSLGVATLADYVAELRGYSAELRTHLVVAALLHDVGHIPLSHSAEPHVKSQLGYGHHELGEGIIRGEGSLGKELSAVLDRSCDRDFLLELLNGNVASVDGGDLFSSPINVDTIEGIFRSYTYLEAPGSVPAQFLITRAAFGERSRDDLKLLDLFWGMKHKVYRDLIHNGLGLISDKLSELFFSDRATLDESDLLSTESEWKKKHPELFSSLGVLMASKRAPSWLHDTTLTFTTRDYHVASGQFDDTRFLCRKEKKHLKIGAAKLGETAATQTSFTHDLDRTLPHAICGVHQEI